MRLAQDSSLFRLENFESPKNWKDKEKKTFTVANPGALGIDRFGVWFSDVSAFAVGKFGKVPCKCIMYFKESHSIDWLF